MWGIPDGVSGPLEFDHTHDYSYDGIMRSYEDSLQRLGMNKIDILVIHDLDAMHFPEAGISYHLSQLFTSGARAGARRSPARPHPPALQTLCRSPPPPHPPHPPEPSLRCSR
jgi:aryl-alcohol dehydrogenase-like predicted oxidoreductase